MKPNKSEVAAKLEAWAKNEQKRLRIDAQYDADIEPHVTRCQRAIAPIAEDRDRKLAPVLETKKNIEAEIMSALEAGIDRETGKVALPQVEVEKAIVRVNVADGDRVIDPKEFLKFTPERNRTEQFYSCLKVLIGPSQKFLGSAIDRLATKAKKFEVKLSLKD